MATNKKKPEIKRDVTSVLYKKKEKKKNSLSRLFENKPLAIVVVSIAVLLVLAITFGATFGTVFVVRRATSVVNYGTITMNKGVANYFVSRLKATYIDKANDTNSLAGDYKEFWESECEPGVTHGERFEKEAEAYLKQLIVAARLYDAKTSLTKEDREIIKKTYEDVLVYQAGGDKEAFNKIGEIYGFDYNDFKKAVTLLYKATQAYGIWYQSTDDLTDEDKRNGLNEYTRVRLLFIRTETKLVTNHETGEVSEINLSEQEKEQRKKIISEIRAAISAYYQGGDGQMNEETFSIYQKDHGEGDSALDEYGYYFHPNAECTKEFMEEFSDVVNAAYGMQVGDYKEVAVSFGTCFVYRCPVVLGAYDVPALERWFSDFLGYVSKTYSYPRVLNESSELVNEGPKFSEMKFLAIPMNTELKVVGFGD